MSDLAKGKADFLVGDLPVSTRQASSALGSLPVKLLNLPTALTATVPCYHLAGVTGALNFSPETLAGILLGRITSWDDVAIRKNNPRTRLPSARIVLIDQIRESGGTDAWTTYLTLFSPQWKKTIGRTTAPALLADFKTAEPEETASLVARTPDSFAFVELWAGKKWGLSQGRVQNRAGQFVEATTQTISTAAKGVTDIDDPQPLLAGTRENQAYPLANFTWITIPIKIADPLKREKLVAMVRWILIDGQGSAPSLFYVPLTKTLVHRELQCLLQVH